MSFNSHDCETVSMKEAQEQEKNNPVTQIGGGRRPSPSWSWRRAARSTTSPPRRTSSSSPPGPTRSAYKKGNIRRYGSDLYRCNQDHTSQADWTPAAAASLWSKIGDPTEEWPEWSQPVGAHDAYNAGAKVSHNGKHWTSDVASNVWEPGVYGWTEVTA